MITKRFWTPGELAEHWTLSFDELSLLTGKNKTARLGFCLQLKFYQQHLSFPSSTAEFSSDVVDYVASQLEGISDELSDYDWSNRTARRHRQEIQTHLGFSSFSDSDEHALRHWLSEEVLPGVPDDPRRYTTIYRESASPAADERFVCPQKQIALLRPFGRLHEYRNVSAVSGKPEE